jgi:hypothetical protein
MQAVHVAAQYGQTAFLNHLIVKYHADFDVPDNDGRSPLHWYTINLLIVMHWWWNPILKVTDSHCYISQYFLLVHPLNYLKSLEVHNVEFSFFSKTINLMEC